MSIQARKYLIIGPAWVGDMVMAQSLCIDLKQRFPNCEIDILAPQWTAALIDRMPQTSRLIPAAFQHGKLSLKERWQLGKSLRNKHYTHSIILPNSLKAALVPAFARIPKRSGFIGEQRWGLINDIRRLNKIALPMTVMRFLALGKDKFGSNETIALQSVPAPALAVTQADAFATANHFNLITKKKILTLCPGAEFGASKQWPTQHYSELADHFAAQGWQVWLLGSNKDIEICQQISQKMTHPATVLAGLTTLPNAVDLLSLATVVVSNDSGLMHIAAGLNRPLVAIYGSTDPRHTPPLNKNHHIATLNLDCAPCFKRSCPLEHHNCMKQLSSAQVITQAEALVQ